MADLISSYEIPPPIRDIGMYTSPFRRFDFVSIFIVFSFSKMADLMALYEIPPHPESSHAFLQQFNFLSFCRFQRWRTLQRHMNYPSTSNQRSGYVYLFFLPIDFASIFIVFSFSKMADLRRHMKYPWLESTLSTLWPLKYTPTPLSAFLIWFDVIRKDLMHDSHASQGWLACLACLTRLARMPRTSDSLTSHASHGWLACLTWLARMPRMVGSHASHASHIIQTPFIVVSTGCILARVCQHLILLSN